jgi:hypothetical protein
VKSPLPGRSVGAIRLAALEMVQSGVQALQHFQSRV